VSCGHAHGAMCCDGVVVLRGEDGRKEERSSCSCLNRSVGRSVLFSQDGDLSGAGAGAGAGALWGVLDLEDYVGGR